MNDYTANAGYATWHARNWRVIPSGTVAERQQPTGKREQ